MLACSVALVLLMDVSSSVDAAEYEQQKQGTANAFLYENVLAAIENSDGIAVRVVEWASDSVEQIPWMVLRSRQDAQRLSSAIGNLARVSTVDSRQFTAVGNAVHSAVDSFADVPCDPERKVIDISSDGQSNDGLPPEIAKQAAEDNDVTVNAIVILDQGSVGTRTADQLIGFYEEKVITGFGRFMVIAEGYETYGESIRRKLMREIASVR